MLVPVQPCNHDGNHDAYMLVLDVNLNYVGRWFIPEGPADNAGIDPGGHSGGWVAVRPGSNEIWTGYEHYLLNAAYGSYNPFYSTDAPDWSGNHVANALLVFDPEIWGHPTGSQTLKFLRAPFIVGLRRYPVSMKTAQGGVFSPSGKVLYLSAGYTGDESFTGVVGDAICWAFDCIESNDYGVITAIDADSCDVAPTSGVGPYCNVLATSGNNVGPFNFRIGDDENTNEPEGLDFFDTACYASDHNFQPPKGFGLSQLHAMVNNDQFQYWGGVYLKHYTGEGLGSSCDSGFGSDTQKVQAVLSAAQGGGFCAGVAQSCSDSVAGSVLVCSDFEAGDATSWLATQGGESVWAIRTSSSSLNTTFLVETSSDNSWHDQTICGAPSDLPQDRTVSALVKLNPGNSGSSVNQGAVVYGLYQDPDNAYYASMRSDGTIALARRVGGVDRTIASLTLGSPSLFSQGWSTLTMRVFPTTDTLHPPAGRLWAVVSLNAVLQIDQLVDSSPNWSGTCAGIGTFGIQAAFDDFVVSSQ